MPAQKRRQRGHIGQLPSGSHRVRVYAGTDALTGRPRQLCETAPTAGAHQHRPPQADLSCLSARPAVRASLPPTPSRSHLRVTTDHGGNAVAGCRDYRSVSNHRRATSPRLSARSGLAFATAAALAGGVLGGMTLVAHPAATATAAPLVVADAQRAAPALPAAAPTKAPVKPSSAPATHRQRTQAPTTTTTKPKARLKAKATEAAFCDKNPDRCTDGMPDKKSDRAEYQKDPRSNAEINSDMPLYAPEGLCPDGYARIAGVC